MARIRIDHDPILGRSNVKDLVSRLAAVTTLISTATTAKAAVVTDRTAASETDATVTTAVTAVGTAITAIQTEVTSIAGDVGASMVVDIDAAKIPDLNTLDAAFKSVRAGFASLGLK